MSKYQFLMHILGDPVNGSEVKMLLAFFFLEVPEKATRNMPDQFRIY